MSLTFEDALPALLTRYDAADAATLDRGRRWYVAAARECRKIGRDTGYTFRQVAAVLAVTSPDAQLSSNIRWTRQACENGGQTAGKYPGQQLPKVRAILGDRRRPGRHVSGPKVTAFYRAILGDPDVLVIDRWASFAAGGPRDIPPRANDRRVLDAAYHAAAILCGESIRDFQAITWIQTRESTAVHKRGRMVIPRLADIV